MNCRFLLSVPLLLSVAVSCRTPGSANLAVGDAPAPVKPNDLPKSTVQFVAEDMAAITDHGGSICKILEKDKTDDFVRVAQKVCDSQDHWLGYVATDGLKTQNELFVGNREALTDLGHKISTSTGARNQIAIQRLVFLEMKLLRDDLALISGDKIKKFESEMLKSGAAPNAAALYSGFTRWAKSLNDHYMKHGNTEALQSPQ